MRDVHALLRQFNLRPRKKLGQHFLISPGALDRIAAEADLTEEDAVLEIGAGLGHLTHRLAAAAGAVVAVEVDRHLMPVLEEEMAGYSNVRLVEGDILRLDPAELMTEQPYKVVANLPYSITSAVLRHLLEARVPPTTIVVTIQREVAERIVARDGRMSLLAVSVQFYGLPTLLFRLKPGAFYPPPAVESAVLRIDRRPELPIPAADVGDFFRIVRAGFAQPRKQLHNNLSSGLRLTREAAIDACNNANISPKRRAERLSIDDWTRLLNVLKSSQ
jgi:16S rRNA (adenine1518-N6/adenine1519-N6)-dimethyltransferase